MGLLSVFFPRKQTGFMAKGDRLSSEGRYNDALIAYEEGLERQLAAPCDEGHPVIQEFREKIALQRRALALLNMEEADNSYSAGNIDRAREHLELARSFSGDPDIVEKADSLRKLLNVDPVTIPPSGRGHDCSSCSTHIHIEESPAPSSPDYAMSLNDSFELLIQPLPEPLYKRYCGLGEIFACSYIAASHDEHGEALSYLDQWWKTARKDDEDIFLYERAKLLYRMGRLPEAEDHFRRASGFGLKNHLVFMGYANLLAERGRFDEAAELLIKMIDAGADVEQASFMLAQVEEQRGRHDEAMALYSRLLATPFRKHAAESLYGILVEREMHAEAENLFRKYLKGCGH